MPSAAREPNDPGLCRRCDGHNIATVVDAFIDRIMTDPRLNVDTRVDDAHHQSSGRKIRLRLSGQGIYLWLTPSLFERVPRAVSETSPARPSIIAHDETG